MEEQLPPSTLWPASSLGARLGVKPRWLIEEAAAGRIPGVRAGETYLFDVGAVERELIRRAQSGLEPLTNQAAEAGEQDKEAV